MVHKVAKSGDIVLDLHLDRDDLEKKAKQACIHLLQKWRQIDPNMIQASVHTFSNAKMYICLEEFCICTFLERLLL